MHVVFLDNPFSYKQMWKLPELQPACLYPFKYCMLTATFLAQHVTRDESWWTIIFVLLCTWQFVMGL